MKKLLAITLASLMLGSNAIGLADVNGADKMNVVNCSSWVSLRSEPSTSSARLCEVPLGATVSDCDTAANGFIKCTYNGETGYIMASYLDQWLEPNPGYEEDNRLDDMQVTNCKEWVSLRSGPSSHNQQIAKVPLGTVLTDCYEAEDGYVWCNYNGQGGYISSRYLKVYQEDFEPNPGYEEDNRLDDMQVTNCKEWVSLRSGPSSRNQQIAKVPLGTVLTDCYKAEDGYVWCNYNGQGGYISSRYLKKYEETSVTTPPETGDTDKPGDSGNEGNIDINKGVKLGDMQVTNCTDWVSMRSGPGSDYSQVLRVPLDAIVIGCVQAGNGYVWCCYNEQMGYISAQYLKEYEEWMEPNPGYDFEDMMGNMKVVNCDDWVSMRSGPSTSSKRIARIPAGTVVYDCYPDENGFIWCNLGGLCGYISSDYLAAHDKDNVPGYGEDDMLVTNCEKWVSMRSRPTSSSTQIAKVPRDAVVTECEKAENGYIRCTYKGQTGYISEDYLETIVG